MRTDSKARNQAGEMVGWVSILVEIMKIHLGEKGISLPANFTDQLKKTFKKKYRKPSPQLFLSRESTLTRIPAGKKWRSSPQCEYLRAVMIERTALSPLTLNILDNCNETIKFPIIIYYYANYSNQVKES